MKVTHSNYNSSNIDWAKMPKLIKDLKNDIDEIVEFYEDDADIKQTVDLFIEKVNKNLPGKIIIAKMPKTELKETIKNTLENTVFTKVFMPKMQQKALLELEVSEEKDFFIKKIKELEQNFLLANKKQDDTIDNTIVYARYFYGGSDWLVVNVKKNDPNIFGYVILNGDTQMSEFGYFNIDEINQIKFIELDFYFEPKKIKEVLYNLYPEEFENPYETDTKNTKTDTKKSKTATKVKKIVTEKELVDHNTVEYNILRRLYNMLKSDKTQPFNKIRSLFMAFNKASVERKVKKDDDIASTFRYANEKFTKIYREIVEPNQASVDFEITDKDFFNEIKKYVTGKKVSPVVNVVKRFISIQGTSPEPKKAATLLKSIAKTLEDYPNHRLSETLMLAKKELQEYLDKKDVKVEVFAHGLQRPSVCKNRIKCTGVDKEGKLKKGYKFQEKTGHIVKVRAKKKNKGLGFVNQNEEPPITEVIENKVVVPNIVFAPVASPIENYDSNKEKNVIPNENPINGDVEILNNNDNKEEETTECKPIIKNKLMNMKFETLPFDEGWEDFMKEPGANMRIGVSGPPKNGKTAGMLKFANYLTKFGSVLYNFADQGFNLSTQKLWKDSGLATKENAEPSDINSFSELKKEVESGKWRFVFIDMISDYIRREKLDPYEFKDFMNKNPKVSFILIFEVTKAGEFKGDQGWMHIVDQMVEVKDFCMETSGRYGFGNYIIWEEKFKERNPKKYFELKNNIPVTQFI